MVGGWWHLVREIFGQTDFIRAKMPIFNRYLLVAPVVARSEKSSINTNRKSTMTFNALPVNWACRIETYLSSGNWLSCTVFFKESKNDSTSCSLNLGIILMAVLMRNAGAWRRSSAVAAADGRPSSIRFISSSSCHCSHLRCSCSSWSLSFPFQHLNLADASSPLVPAAASFLQTPAQVVRAATGALSCYRCGQRRF